MSLATMTLIGLNNYLSYYEKDLFEQLSFPEGIDKTTAINNILLFCGENELLYSDADFNINLVGLWSTKWYRTFQKWIDVLSEEYEPLENYDRKENWSDSASTSESNSAYASDSSVNSTSLENNVSAFNVSSYSDESASNQDGHAQSITDSRANSDKLDYSVHGGRVHGNIGVMTTQAMLQQELDVQRFNIYDEIAIIFAREFTLAL